jgi:hypothetical protein
MSEEGGKELVRRTEKEREVVRRRMERKEGERMTEKKEGEVVRKWMERNEGEVVRRIERKGERQ